MSQLQNIFLKLDKADKKASDLTGNISAFCRDNPISLEAKLREGRLGVDLIYQMQELNIPLKEWSLELGEIAYSLRSALDNLIYYCAQCFADPPKNPRCLQFPIIQEQKEYSNAVKYIVPQLPKSIAELLEKIQPFNRAMPNVEGTPQHDPLVLLNWISNHDKHRMPVPFLVPPNQMEFANSCQFASEEEASANVPPDVTVYADPLSHGNTLLEYRTKHPVNKAFGQIKITAHVAIETHCGRREISEAVGQLTWYTRLVVNEFSKIL